MMPLSSEAVLMVHLASNRREGTMWRLARVMKEQRSMCVLPGLMKGPGLANPQMKLTAAFGVRSLSAR